MNWINSDNLDQWSENHAAQTQLPKLIRKLIFATNNVGHIDMPADGGIGKHGFDGILEAHTGNAFVPIGKSVWEMGCGQGSQAKANEDYNKRENDSNKETSFVFVTSRRWSGVRQWAEEKNKEEKWKEVRAYDADSLATWIEQAPGVELWLSGLIGTRPQGAYDLESWWEEQWQNVTSPKLTPEVILAKRNDIAQKILAKIKTQQTASIQGPSIESSIAFLAATFLTDPEKQSEHLLSRAIIVDSQEAARQLVKVRDNLILIPRGQEATQACAAAHNQGHIVCICRDPETRSDKNDDIKIPYPTRSSFQETLKDFFEQADKEKNYFKAKSEAETRIRETGMDLEVLRQRLALMGKLDKPEWARGQNAQDFVAALFVGQWNSGQDMDRELLSYISGKDYSELEDIYRGWRDTPNAPLMQTLGIWKLTSPIFAWKNIARQASRQQWNKFREIAKSILPDSENPSGGWHQHELKKEGIVQSLAILSNRMTEEDDLDLGISPKTWVDNLVREITENPTIFVQQSSFLFDLSEAAPDIFLEALEKFISENPSKKLTKTMAQNTSLMWVLGSLAWVSNHLPRVTRCLSNLVKNIDNEQVGPTPRQTLYQIFLPWLPQTEVSAEKREQIISGLMNTSNEIGWQLLMDIFPKAHGTSMNHATPIWLDFKPPSNPTYKEHFEHVGALLDLVAENIGSDPKRWQEAIEHISYFPDDQLPYLRTHIEKFIQKLQEVSSHIQGEDKVPIWESLNDFVSHHRQFSYTPWALSEEDLRPWAELRESLTPDDLISRHAHLFSHDPKIGLPIEKENTDWEKREKEIDTIRQKALEEICQDLGENGLRELAEKSEDIYTMSFALKDISEITPAGSNLNIEAIMEEWLGEENMPLACAVDYFFQQIRKKQQEENNKYRSAFIQKAKENQWPNQKIANMLSTFPCNSETWKKVSEFGQEVEKLYWESRFTFRPESKKDRSKFIENALKFNQLMKASRTISLYHKELPGNLLAKFLERVAEDQNAVSRSDGHLITEMILGLQRKKISDNRLMSIEKAYLKNLWLNFVSERFREKHLVLHRNLAADPKFFVGYIELIYRKKSDNEENLPEPSPEKKAKAMEGYHLMQTWSLAPGMQEDETINCEQLIDWIRKARALLEKLDRISVGDEQIGEMLGRVTLRGKDGIWPIEAIREVLEKTKSDDIKRGILIGEFNMRGVYTPSAGREQLDAAKKCEEQSQKLDNQWPETAKLLREMAKRHRIDAQDEKTRAEMDSFLD